MMLFNNEKLDIFFEEENVFLIVKALGLNLVEFNKISGKIPRLKLTKFGAVKNALDIVTGKKTLIGTLKNEIEVQVSSDEMSAYIVINMTDEEYKQVKKDISNSIIYTLKEEGIVEGIKTELFNDDLPLRKKLLIAEGVKPEKGEDAVLKYYEFGDKKPVIKTDGKMNHYELNLIDNVEKGTWVGEKTPATFGKDGISVKQNPVIAKMGQDSKLLYDVITINHEIHDTGKEYLFAKVDGAIKMKSGKVCIENHLIIMGDVEYSTGNIDFDGFVTVTGTVKDKFSVVATHDISINGEMGIGSVECIKSHKGSILIKGGINGKGSGLITAKQDVFTKYANEATIIAGESINVGFYAIDAIMTAKKILLPSEKGRIIGGQTNAEHRIETGSIGNKYEKPTVVSVQGFERNGKLEELELFNDEKKEKIKQINKLKRELDIFEKNVSKLDKRAMATLDYMLSKYDTLVNELTDISDRIKSNEDILRTRGEGEVSISKNIFPRTILEIKNLQKRFRDKSTGSYYVKDSTFCHNIN